MKFGPEPTADCVGAILAHGYRLGDGASFKKGQLLDQTDVDQLLAHHIVELTVARLEPGDLGEDEGARAIGQAAGGDGLRLGTAATGRVNLYAQARGLVIYDPAGLDKINRISEAATLAAATPFSRAERGQIIATAKIIPLGLPAETVTACVTLASQPSPLISLAPFKQMRVGLLQTQLPFATEKLLDKTRLVLNSRIKMLDSELVAEQRTPHTVAAVAATLADMAAHNLDLILVMGASATTDRRDVVPQAVVAAGGSIEHFGMPVDPGNLTIVCRIGATIVLGLPGSARSPRRGGNDWLLERIAAGLPITSAAIMGLGSGGLLKEIASRPLPREAAAPASDRPRAQKEATPSGVAAILLAAGQSRRMGTENKLLAEIDGRPLVVHAVRSLLAANCHPVIVVVGHQADEVRASLAGLEIDFIENPEFATGLSSSLAAGIEAVPAHTGGALVALGDMPRLTTVHIEALVDAFADHGEEAICVPVWQGRRGNPVIWGRAYFDEICALEGDVGARHLIGIHTANVHEVAMQDDAIFDDIDTPADLAAQLAAARSAGRRH